ncbi:MAG: 2-dehydropantoate 2-reductase [Polyangiaceae bacterium]|nr:2-dehydropantoate 2-reductase [Polyangiaceae bacterium]
MAFERIGVVGAGAIGGYLGARLSAAGYPVTLFQRAGKEPGPPPLAVNAKGVVYAPSPSLRQTSDPQELAGINVCLVAVKTLAVPAIAETLSKHLAPSAVVVSFQNGLRAAGVLRAALGDRVVPGIVTYNVYIDELGRRCQATTGKLLAGIAPEPWKRRLTALQTAFRAAGETLELRKDMDRVAAGKLLVNLNNGVCAATGLGIAASLADRDARFCYAACIREGLVQMSRAGMRPASVTAIPPALLPTVLLLPNWVVTPMARAVAGVRPEARLSTLQDLDHGRLTEMGDLNGAIVEMAQERGDFAPANEVVTGIVREHELRVTSGRAPNYVSPAELRRRVESAFLSARSSSRSVVSQASCATLDERSMAMGFLPMAWRASPCGSKRATAVVLGT